MMMPANFSAISENEMTYVNGGASLADILAPELKLADWQRFNTNMVTIIGNQFVGAYVDNTIGKLFNGSYVPGDMGKAWFGGVNKAFGTGKGIVEGKELTGNDGFDAFLAGSNGVLNAGLRMVGSAAAIYNLSRGTVTNAVDKNAFDLGFKL